MSAPLAPAPTRRTPDPQPKPGRSRPVALLAIQVLLWGGDPRPAAAQAPDLAHLDATRERPLFVQARRPPPPPPVAAPQASRPAATPPAPSPPSLQLSGVVIGRDRSIAIVKRLSDARLVSLEVGRAIDGWTVEGIRPREIDLRQGERKVTIRLANR